MSKVSGYFMCPKCGGTEIFIKNENFDIFGFKKFQKSNDKYIFLLDIENRDIWVNHILYDKIKYLYKNINYICDEFGTMNAGERAEKEEYMSNRYRKEFYNELLKLNTNSSEDIWNKYGGSTKEQWIDHLKEWKCRKCEFSSETFLDFRRLITSPTSENK